MRLDEWQKYLDAQFVDEAQEAKARSANVGDAAPEKANGARASRQPAYALGEAAWVIDTPPIVAPLPKAEETTPAISQNRGVPPAADPTPGRKETQRKVVSSESTRVLPFGEPPTIQADIPSFENYLPSTHAAVQAEANLPSSPKPSAEPAEPPTAKQSPDMLIGAFSVLMPMNPYSIPRTSSPSTPSPEKPSFEEVNEPRRTPRARARHARNVRPEHVPSGLSAAELWATVPKHVQTLLALGRMEEIEEEVAQSSYKRPFQETRQELIERLLDPILSLEDTARLLNVCPTTVRRYTNRGILTHYRKEPEHPSTGGNSEKETRQRRFRLSDILAYLETQQAAAENDRNSESRHAGSRGLQIEDSDTKQSLN